MNLVWAWDYRCDTHSLSPELRSTFAAEGDTFDSFLQTIASSDRIRISFAIRKSMCSRRNFTLECRTSPQSPRAGMRMQIQGNLVATAEGDCYRGYVKIDGLGGPET